MAQFGKASSKKSKPSYVYAIIGVSLVLYLFGLVGWVFINLRKTGDYFKENIQVHATLNRDAKNAVIDSAANFLQSMPAIKSVEYVSKEMAIKKYESENDTAWRQFIRANPLPPTLDYYVKAGYMEKDSLQKIANIIQENFPGLVSSFDFPQEVVAKVGKFAQNLVVGFLIAALILTILVIFSIDNTIRLAMYSNRFLIKTMQMVGATRWFISKPLDIRAVMNGLISAIVAIACLYATILFTEHVRVEIKVLRDNGSMLALFGFIIILGILISLLSTHRAVIKYLKLKLDDLY